VKNYLIEFTATVAVRVKADSPEAAMVVLEAIDAQDVRISDPCDYEAIEPLRGEISHNPAFPHSINIDCRRRSAPLQPLHDLAHSLVRSGDHPIISHT